MGASSSEHVAGLIIEGIFFVAIWAFSIFIAVFLIGSFLRGVFKYWYIFLGAIVAVGTPATLIAAALVSSFSTALLIGGGIGAVAAIIFTTAAGAED